MTTLTRFVVYIPEEQASKVRARALRQHPSVSAYLKSLVDQDQSAKTDTVRADNEKLDKRLDELLEFCRYIMVVQNATAERLSPGLVAEIHELYRKEVEAERSGRA